MGIEESADDTSADPAALGRYADAAGELRDALVGKAEELRDLRERVARFAGEHAVPAPSIDGAGPDRAAALASEWVINETFAAAVATALREADGSGTGVVTVSDAAVVAHLGDTAAELTAAIAAQLRAGGLDTAQAEKLAGQVAALVAADDTLTVRAALVVAVAAVQGVTVEELEQRWRAFSLDRDDVATVLADSYDLVAGADGITVDGLQLVIDDPSVPERVRDAAYRLAADSALFDDLDVADETATITPVGYDRSRTDGRIAPADLAVFAGKDAQIRLVLPWRILLDTATEGYDLAAADGSIQKEQIDRFVRDGNIPYEVRRAVWDFYSENDSLKLLGLDPLPVGPNPRSGDPTDAGPALGFGIVTGRTTVRGRGPTIDLGGGPTEPAAAAGGGGTTIAGLVALLLADQATDGANRWLDDHFAPGHPGSIRIIHPLTGQPVDVPLDDLVDLSTAQLYGHLRYLAATGEPPPQVPLQLIPPDSTYGPRGYVDAWDGQDVATRRGTYVDHAGIRRYVDTDEPVWQGTDLHTRLSADPANGGKVDHRTKREAEVGLDLVAMGLLPGPLRRDPQGGAEFYDGVDQLWDVKGFVSVTDQGFYVFKLDAAARKIEQEILLGENVIVDTLRMSDEDVERLRTVVRLRGLDNHVIWY